MQALAVAFGPQAAGWDAALCALKAAKTDISRPVREAAAAALPVVAALQRFIGAKTPVQQWPAACQRLLASGAAGQPTQASPPSMDAGLAKMAKRASMMQPHQPTSFEQSAARAPLRPLCDAEARHRLRSWLQQMRQQTALPTKRW
jgi:hypothetical protein